MVSKDQAGKLFSIRLGNGSPTGAFDIYVVVNGSSTRTTDDPIASANTWYHVVVSYNGSAAVGQRVKIYVNGNIRTMSGNAAPSLPASHTGTRNLEVGRETPSPLTDHLDEVAMWLGTTGTGMQASELYNSGVLWDLSTSTLGQPTHWFKFENNHNDDGSNPTSGTAIGTPTFSTIVPP
jgi:hypothetical protein